MFVKSLKIRKSFVCLLSNRSDLFKHAARHRKNSRRSKIFLAFFINFWIHLHKIKSPKLFVRKTTRGNQKFCRSKQNAGRSILADAEDFFASSPTANLVGTTKKDTKDFPPSTERGCEAMWTSQPLCLFGSRFVFFVKNNDFSGGFIV